MYFIVFNNGEVEAAGDEASGRSYGNEHDYKLKPYTDEPLAEEEWLANYRKNKIKKLERELRKRLENHVLVREW